MLWRRKARRLLRAKGYKPGAATAEAAIRWDFAREARDEWGGPLMGPDLVLDMDLESYREPEAVLGQPLFSRAFRDVLAERERQVDAEGWDADHDDEHLDGELARAAAAYALWDAAGERVKRAWENLGLSYPDCWPWALAWWKPRTRRENLVRAGALILAEIERLDRAEARDA